MSLKAFHIVFIIFSTLIALGTGVWCLWVNLVEGAPIYVAGEADSFVVAIVLVVYAIWFLFAAVISVIGGIGAFSFHLWRHGRMPVEPHQELTEEDLSKYE